MIACVTSKDGGLESWIDPDFDRCVFFIFYDTVTKVYRAFKNPYSGSMECAGIKSAEFVSFNGAEKIISGYAGPEASAAIKGYGMGFIHEQGCPVKEVLERHFG